MRTQASVWPYITFTGLVFGSGGLISKALVDGGVDPFTIVWFPFLGGGALGLIVSIVAGEFRRASVLPAALLGVFASSVPAILFNLGFEKLPAGIVSLLISLGPVFTALAAHFVFPDERFNRRKALGLLLAITGVSALASGSLRGGASAGAIGLVVAGAVVAGGSGVVTRRVATVHGATALIAPQLVAAGLTALVLASALGRPLAPAKGFALWQLLTMAGSGITSYLGFRALLRASEIGTTGQVSVIGYCIPLFGVVGGIVFFDDPVTASLVLGGLLIVVAVAAIASGSRVVAPGRSPAADPVVLIDPLVAGASGA